MASVHCSEQFEIVVPDLVLRCGVAAFMGALTTMRKTLVSSRGSALQITSVRSRTEHATASFSAGFNNVTPARRAERLESPEPVGTTARAARSTRKRVFDFSFALGVLVTLLPAFLLIALLIKATSSGTILFRQKRYGLNGQLFEIWKFRTMHVALGDRLGVTQTCANDARITPIGRFLRRTSLDELPQLVNVLKGEMSLIGPRPHVPGMLAGGVLYEHLVPRYPERHIVRPGISGLAQVSGYRGSTTDPVDGKLRVDYDIKYIECWSFWLDLQILMRTVVRELTGGTGI